VSPSLGRIDAEITLVVPVTVTQKNGLPGDFDSEDCTVHGELTYRYMAGVYRFGSDPVSLLKPCAPHLPAIPPPPDPPNASGNGGGFDFQGDRDVPDLEIPSTQRNSPPSMLETTAGCESGEEGVCARVRVRLDQDVVIARTGFQATLELE